MDIGSQPEVSSWLPRRIAASVIVGQVAAYGTIQATFGDGDTIYRVAPGRLRPLKW